jgi:hypothetical protein
MWSVAVLFDAIHPQSAKIPDDPLWEESIIVVDAWTEEEARKKAEAFAKKEEVSYRAISGEQVEWRFLGVIGSHEICDEVIKDGTEVFSRFLNEKPHNIPDPRFQK